MKMNETIETNVSQTEERQYRFSELSDRAKQRALDKHYASFEPYTDWYHSVYEMAIEDGKEKGFGIDEIQFSGFWSQGDGACWEGYINLKKWATTTASDPSDPKLLMYMEIAEDGWAIEEVKIMRDRISYHHEGTMKLITELSCYARDDTDLMASGLFEGKPVLSLWEAIGSDFLDELEKDILESAKDYARKIYRMLEGEYEYLTSDEYISEMCDANDWFFNEEGEMV